MQMFVQNLALKPTKETKGLKEQMQFANIAKFLYAILLIRPTVFSLAKLIKNL